MPLDTAPHPGASAYIAPASRDELLRLAVVEARR